MSTTLSNWRTSPHNQYSFINVDKLLRTRTIQRSTNPLTLPSAPFPIQDAFRIRSGHNVIDLPTYMQTTSTDGLIVLHRGEIVFEECANGNDVNSKHIMMSVTKSLIGLLAGVLVDRGELETSDLVTKHVPEASRAFHNVTIRQLLDMQSGVLFNDNDPVYQFAAGWKQYSGEPYRNVHEFLASFEPERTEDGRFEFTGVNTDMLGWVIERAAGHGKTIAQMLQELLWQPLGAESDALVCVDDGGTTRAASGLCATLRDIARVGQLVADGGRGIVSQEWLRDMTKGDKEAFAKSKWPELCVRGEFEALAYRSCWFHDEPTGVVFSVGIHGQMLFVDPVNDIVVARSGSQERPLDYRRIHLTFVAWKEIRRVLVYREADAAEKARL